ncbi:sigma 54-interacting transcriptional regulator [Salicibibacter cibarius]|uniref:Sigma 54-interacting transcriptional regulator n=1 Tax=Salicibibacter cibarius TaxID=2743000 RepID=A0A7T7CAC0_9BACI|nr:sigma 54-interacting transcriptional regulator [Salicibibacter cibarius]QQK74569.1 sigma 54-interacting transcriptional regulator [Salicibibacter cibarius]
MHVGELSATTFVKLQPDTTARETMELFLQNRQDIGCVMEHEHLLGIVTKYSLYRLLLKSTSMDVTIQPAIKTNVISLQENISVYRARDILLEKGVGHAVVLNNNKNVVGVLATSDLIYGLVAGTNHLMTRLQSLVDNLQESVISVDTELNITAINASAQKLFQLEDTEILGKPSGNWFPTLYDDLSNAVLHSKRTEVKKISLHSTIVIASIIPIQEWGKINGAMAVLKDITELEKVANELESTKRIEKVLDSALAVAYDGVIITDQDGNITKANHGFMELYGIASFSQIEHQPLQNIAPEIQQQQNKNKKDILEAEIIQINQYKAIVSQTPIVQNDKTIGSIYKIIYQHLHLWKDLFNQIDKLEREISYYRGELNKNNDPFTPLISNNGKIEQLKADATAVAPSLSNLLINGESGTGKELLANGIHLVSNRKGAFIKINCAAVPENLIESELFGYADGAFTGAKKGGRPGKFEQADKGTLFLDEIGDMSLPMQAKLLRAVQEKEIERIGDTQTRKMDVRILAASNKNIGKLVQEGVFREDLYYRINVIQLEIPPLRDRLDDIPLLTNHFMKKMQTKLDKPSINDISSEAVEKLRNYHWPGNVRQMENVMERAFLYAQTNRIEASHILIDAKDPSSTEHSGINEANEHGSVKTNRKKRMEETDKVTILDALKQAGGNRTIAAKKLGISRSTLYQKLKKYEIKEKLEFFL